MTHCEHLHRDAAPMQRSQVTDRFPASLSHPALLTVIWLLCVKNPWTQANKHLEDMVCSGSNAVNWLLSFVGFRKKVEFHVRMFCLVLFFYKIILYNIIRHDIATWQDASTLTKYIQQKAVCDSGKLLSIHTFRLKVSREPYWYTVYNFFAPVLLTETDENSRMLAIQCRAEDIYLAKCKWETVWFVCKI